MARNPPPFLSARWWNARVENVMEQLEELLIDRAMGKLLVDNYLPLETPVTAADLRRMTPDQLADYIATLPSIEEKADALAKVGRVPPTLLPSAKQAKRTTFAQ